MCFFFEEPYRGLSHLVTNIRPKDFIEDPKIWKILENYMRNFRNIQHGVEWSEQKIIYWREWTYQQIDLQNLWKYWIPIWKSTGEQLKMKLNWREYNLTDILFDHWMLLVMKYGVEIFNSVKTKGIHVGKSM